MLQVVLFSVTAVAAGWWADGATPGSVAAASPAANAAPADIRRWIADLASDTYAVREAATIQLIGAGASAVPAVLSAAVDERLEVSCRAVRVLRMIYQSDDDAAIDAAESALEALAVSPARGAARRAAAALSARMLIRQKRAIARIHALGGVVKLETMVNGVVLTGEHGEPRVAEVRLLRGWTGGDAGLVEVKRLSGLQKVFVIEGSNISDAALKDLQDAMPQIKIDRRGQALLGIRGSVLEKGKGCQIDMIEEGSAAEKAGLDAGDTLLTFDGRPLGDFEDLIEATRAKKSGDKVQVGVLRDGQRLNIEVILGGWEDKK